MGQSSGECVQGVKTPCAFNQHVFLNFFQKFKNTHSVAKRLFDTLTTPKGGFWKRTQPWIPRSSVPTGLMPWLLRVAVKLSSSLTRKTM